MGENDELDSQKGIRQLNKEYKAKSAGTVDACWKKLDRKSKKLTFSIKVINVASSSEIAQMDLLDTLKAALQDVENKLEQVSFNIYAQ